ncbi:permease [Bacillus sp. RG28]|uniref:Permease n=1 Tax=Gottfriedia endophytica TaxID=2820819 RepID=A0A940NRT1_9BACI|nr:ABC transporter permease subunit [Gottfriedia endophytica]MBP0725666.1 permease [Gottfriedia endophytica]
MNATLYKSLLKKNSKLILGYALGSSLFLLAMTTIFPSMKTVINEKMSMLKDMPKGMLAAFGLEQGLSITSVPDFLSTEYYSMIFLVLMTLFTLSLAAKLLSHLVEQGSMAYILSTPVSRIKVVLTIMGVFITGLFFTLFCNFTFSYLGAVLVGEKIKDLSAFFNLHLVGFLFFFAIGGYCFLFSTLLTEEKKAVAYAGGLTLLFYLLDLMGRLSDKFEMARYVSVFYLYQPSEILKNNINILSVSLILFIIGFITYFAALFVFKRRNLYM